MDARSLFQNVEVWPIYDSGSTRTGDSLNLLIAFVVSCPSASVSRPSCCEQYSPNVHPGPACCSHAQNVSWEEETHSCPMEYSTGFLGGIYAPGLNKCPAYPCSTVATGSQSWHHPDAASQNRSSTSLFVTKARKTTQWTCRCPYLVFTAKLHYPNHEVKRFSTQYYFVDSSIPIRVDVSSNSAVVEIVLVGCDFIATSSSRRRDHQSLSNVERHRDCSTCPARSGT